MNFTRSRVRGRTQKTYREWHSDDGNYRVTWRNEVAGVHVRAGYHATVLSVNHAGHIFWSFCTVRRPFKKFELAVEACEKNRRLWEAFCKIADTERKGRADRVRALDVKATIGSGAAAHKVMSVLPVWVDAAAEPFLLRILFPIGRREAEDECDESDQPSNTPASPSTDTSTPTPESATDSTIQHSSHVPTAKVVAESTTPAKNRTRSKATNSATASRARPAKARAKARGKKPGKPTKRRSRATGKG